MKTNTIIHSFIHSLRQGERERFRAFGNCSRKRRKKKERREEMKEGKMVLVFPLVIPEFSGTDLQHK